MHKTKQKIVVDFTALLDKLIFIMKTLCN